jgi:hypothetical protein
MPSLATVGVGRLLLKTMLSDPYVDVALVGGHVRIEIDGFGPKSVVQASYPILDGRGFRDKSSPQSA